MYKYLPKNYEIVEDQKPTGVTKFKFIKILKEDEDYIDGDKVKERAKESKGFYGMSELEYIFEHQDLVPNDVGYIIFPATVLRDPSGSLYVPFSLKPKAEKTVRLMVAWHVPGSDLRVGADPKPAEGTCSGSCACGSAAMYAACARSTSFAGTPKKYWLASSTP